MQHEQETDTKNHEEALNTSLHDIELAVERGKQDSSATVTEDRAEMRNIEFQLKGLAALASKKGVGGGLLHQIRSFNGFLERAALELETSRT